MLRHARLADDAGLDAVGLSDHPYLAERVDAYSAPRFVLGATSNITGAASCVLLIDAFPRGARSLVQFGTEHGSVFC